MNVLGNNVQIHNQFMVPALAAIPSPRYNVSTGLAAICGNFVDGHVQTQRGIGGSAPNETMICALREDSDQPGAQGSCYTTLSAWGKLEVL